MIRMKNLEKWIIDFENTEHPNTREEAIDLGFESWVCEEDTLVKRIAALLPKVKAVAKGPRVDPRKVFVQFFNVKPAGAQMYFYFEVRDLASYEVALVVTPFDGRKGRLGTAHVEDGAGNVLVDGKWSDVRDFFAVAPETDDKIDVVPPAPKPRAKVVGKDGNVFNLLGICRESLAEAGMNDRIDDMISKVVTSKSYEEALATMSEYCELF